jgi:hypothetical protein
MVRTAHARLWLLRRQLKWLTLRDTTRGEEIPPTFSSQSLIWRTQMSLGQMNLALTLTSVNVNDITEIDISIEKIFDNYGEAKNFLDKIRDEKFVNSDLYNARIESLQEEEALSHDEAAEYFYSNYSITPLLVGMP